MAKRRARWPGSASSSNAPQPQPPPPPYDDAGSHCSEFAQRGPHMSDVELTAPSPLPGHYHQTIPKAAEAGEMSPATGERAGLESKVCEHAQRLNELNKLHTCAPGARNQNQPRECHNFAKGVQGNGPPRRRSLTPVSDPSGHDQFVRSLSAPKSVFGKISIEPLAFLAILALYIEFPAIQDLIYTKICLEVVANRPDLISAQPVAANLGGGTNATHPQQIAANHSLPSNGRIQNRASSPMGHSVEDNGGSNDNNNNSAHSLIIPWHAESPARHESRQLHLLCDRLNRTAIPRAVRQEILDLDTTFWLKYQILVCLLCALASPYWGGLSDKIGRVVPLNAPIVAGIASNAISLAFGLLISTSSHALFRKEWLFSGAVIVGLSGGQAVLIMNAFSFLSDNTTNEERSKRVTGLESVIFVAHSVGFFLSKMIMLLGLGAPDRPWLNRHFVAFGACVVLNVISILYSVAKLRHHKFHRFLNNYERERREAAAMGSSSSLGGISSSSNVVSTLGGDAQRGAMHAGRRELAAAADCQLANGERLRELTSSTPDDPDGPIARSDKTNWAFWDTMVTFKYYRETFEIATRPRETRATILLLLLSGFLSSLSLAALMSLFFTYLKSDPFNWSTSQYSSWNALSSISRGVALIGLAVLMRFVASWHVPDTFVAALGFLGKGAGLITIGLAQSSAAINWSLVAFAFSEYSMPPIRSLLSKLVVCDELGKVYSCLGTLQSLCFILGNVAFYVAFNSYVQQNFFRVAFLAVGGIEVSAVVVMLAIYTSR